MKILHADTDDMDNPLAGGQPIRTFSVNRHLALGHDITVLTSTFKGAERKVVRDGIKYVRLGLRIPPFGLSPHLTYLACLGPAVRLMQHDLVVEEFMAPVGFAIPPIWTKKPVITIIQWFFFEIWQERYGLPFFNWMKRIGEKARYRYFIVQTDTMKRQITALFPWALCEKIPCGIGPEAFTRDSSQGEEYVLFLGRLDCKQKGLDILLKTWSGICLSHPVPLIIAGDGEDRQGLQQLVSRYDLGKHVRFVGRVEGARKTRLLSGCRFMVMPSRYETFGLSALEAMAAGKAVAAFDIDNLNEILSPSHAVLVKRFDQAALGRAVIELWNRPELCKKLGAQGRHVAKDYLWERLAAIQEGFYQEVVRESHP